jgi:hypothetical protein
MEELIEKRYQILQKTSQQRERIGGRRLPRIREPTRECTHWDYFLEEMKWMANDFIEDRKHKQALAFVLTNEISHKKSTLEKNEAKKESASREQAKKLSDLIMKYFYQVDDSKKSKVSSKPTEKIWKVAEVTTTPLINIVLKNSRNKLVTKLDESKPVFKHSLQILTQFGYSYQDKVEELLNQEPSTPETGVQGDDLDGFEAISNFKLFYDAETGEKDLNVQLEELHLEDLDVYRPLITDTIEFRDITYEETMLEEELFELVPDSEEYMLLESTKRALDSKEPEVFHTVDTNFVSKRDWKIFEDLILEQTVCEFGGNWEFVSDLLSSHNLTTFNYVTPEECFNRWAILQKRKGRIVSHNFRPAQVFQNSSPPVQGVQCGLSLMRKKPSNIYIFPRVTQNVVLENPSSSFEFYLSHNIRPEMNEYFQNYKAMNSRFYNEERNNLPLPVSRNRDRIMKEVQGFIDKEDENNLSVCELVDNNKPEPAARGVTGMPASRRK